MTGEAEAKIICGNCLDVLREMESESIDCCITSPPYWALRDYGIEGQIGLEPTIAEYVDNICTIFDEVKRVLKSTGTCWLNMGDTYYGSGKGIGTHPSKREEIYEMPKEAQRQSAGKELPPKSLCQVPSRVSIEMANRGWILRNEIIWEKPNSMPSSASDRFSVNYEKIFFFVKSRKYSFNEQLVDAKESSIKRLNRAVSNHHKWINGPDGQPRHTMSKPRVNARRNNLRISAHHFGVGDYCVSPFTNPRKRKMRSVWVFTTKGTQWSYCSGCDSLFQGKARKRIITTTEDGIVKHICPSCHSTEHWVNHFATYPQDLVRRMLVSGSNPGDLVLFPFCGSGTTLLECLNQGRNGIGIELNIFYYKAARARLRAHRVGEQMKIL